MLVGLIGRYWRGDGPLWRVFWIYGVLFSWAAGVPVAALSGYGLISPLVTAACIAFGAIYTVWIVISVWRCAYNVDGAPFGQSGEFWGSLARAMTIAWGINFIGLAWILMEASLEFYAAA